MAINDTEMEEWLTVDSSNAPSNNSYIGTDLAAQFRNIKSAYKVFSVNKMYERPKPAFYSNPSAYLVYIVAEFKGEILSYFQKNRKIFARSPSGGIAPGFVVNAAYISGLNARTRVTAVFWDIGSGGWTADKTEWMVGIDRDSPAVFPLGSIGGCAQLTDSDTQCAVSFTAATSATDASNGSGEATVGGRTMLPTKNYFVSITPCFSEFVASGTDTTNASNIIVKVAKDFNGFTFDVAQAPGSGITVYYDWVVTLPEMGI